MNLSPKISVVMPVYNGDAFLEEAIESILNQSFPDFEFIIAYDESTDKTLEIINKYKEKDARIVLNKGKKRGLVRSLNDAFGASKGEYVARMDADDISLPGRIKLQYELMLNKELDICGGHYLLIDDKGKINGLNVIPTSHEMCTLSLFFKVPFCAP